MAAKLVSVVEKRDITCLVESVKQFSIDGSLEDSLAGVSRRQLEDLWDGVLSLCLSTLLDSEKNGDENQDLDQMCDVLQCVTSLASATLKSLGQTRSHGKNGDENIAIPQSLHEAAVILHGVLPTLTTESGKLKDEMSRLFEYWWHHELPGSEELMGNTIVYLLNKSTQAKSTQADVGRVKAVHKVLAAIDLSSDSASTLVSLLLQCTFHHQFVTTSQGIKFLAYLFTLNSDVIEKLHQNIKNHLPSTPKSWHSKYGEIYFRAWQRTMDDKREKLEQYCIQDLMYRAVHSHREGQGSMAKTLFRLLSFIHKEKNQRGVEAMLCRLYEPILWRSLMVTNSDVRANAAGLMFDVFPLQDPTMHNEQADAALQKQFDVMHDLLSDPMADVRLIAVTGVGKILNIYWELIPAQVIQCFVTKLVQDLAYDISSPSIREAVIKVMYELCDNHLCIPMLKKILPELQNFVHDTSEKVRIAMFDLLLKVKGLRPIKFWNVVPVEHILARLEVDSASIGKRIMKLILSSFVPLQQPPAEQVERCVALIKENPGAARQFFLNLPPHLGLHDTVKYMVMLCQHMLEAARQRYGSNNSNSRSYNSDSSFNSSGNDSTAEAEGSSNKGKNSSQKKPRKNDEVDNEVQSDNSDDDSREDGVKVNGCKTETDMEIFRGLVEAVYLMFTVTLDELSQPDNKQIKESLAKKLSVTVRELMAISKDPGLDAALVALAGHLPPRALPLIAQNLLNRLKQGSQSMDKLDTTSVVKSLVLWGKSESLVEMIKESVDKALKVDSEDEEATGSVDNDKRNAKQKKRTVAFNTEDKSIDLNLALDLLVKMVSQAECRPMLLSKQRQSLMSLVRAFQPAMSSLRKFLARTDTNNLKSDVEVFVTLYTMYLRLSAFLCTSNKDKVNNKENVGENIEESQDAQKAVNNALTWCSSCVMTHLAVEGSGTEAGKITVNIMEATLKICRSLLTIGVCDASFLDQIVQICMTVLQAPPSQHLSLTSQALACVYQLSQIRKLPKTSENTTDPKEDDTKSELTCSCLCQFLKTLVQGCSKEKTANGKSSDETENQNDSTEDKGASCNSHIMTTVNPAIGEIILELTRPGKPAEVAEKTLLAVLDSVMKETQICSEEDRLGVGDSEKLPPLSSALLSVVGKRLGTKRMFIELLHDRTDSGDVTDIHQVHGIVAALAHLRQGSDDLVPPSLYRSVNKVLQSLPVSMDEDVFNDMKRQMETQIERWSTADERHAEVL